MVSVRTALLVAATVCIPRVGMPQTDFDTYVEQIRKTGMSESASNALRMVARVLSGASAFKATHAANGTIGRAYDSMTFPPTLGEKLLEEQRAKLDAWMKLLQKQADRDGSGFVSTEEGYALQRMVETGLIAAQLGITDADELAKAVFKNRAGAVADIAAYSRLLAAAAQQGLEGLPGLPPGLAGTG
jgi:hypothetical protein